MSMQDSSHVISSGQTQATPAAELKEETLTTDKQLMKLDTAVRKEGLKAGVLATGSRQALQEAAGLAKKGDDAGALEQLKLAEENLVQEFGEGKVPEEIQTAVTELKESLGEVEVKPEVGKMITGQSAEKNPEPKHGIRTSGYQSTAQSKINDSGSQVAQLREGMSPQMRKRMAVFERQFQEGKVAGRSEKGAGKLEGGKRPQARPTLGQIGKSKGFYNRTITVAANAGVAPKQAAVPQDTQKAVPKQEAPKEAVPKAAVEAAPKKQLSDQAGAVKKATVLANSASMIAGQASRGELNTAGRDGVARASHRLNVASAAIEKGSYKEAISFLKEAEGSLEEGRLQSSPGMARDNIIDIKNKVTELRQQIEKETTTPPQTAAKESGQIPAAPPKVEAKTTGPAKPPAGPAEVSVADKAEKKEDRLTEIHKELGDLGKVAKQLADRNMSSKEGFPQLITVATVVGGAQQSVEASNTDKAAEELQSAVKSLDRALEVMGDNKEISELRDQFAQLASELAKGKMAARPIEVRETTVSETGRREEPVAADPMAKTGVELRPVDSEKYESLKSDFTEIVKHSGVIKEGKVVENKAKNKLIKKLNFQKNSKTGALKIKGRRIGASSKKNQEGVREYLEKVIEARAQGLHSISYTTEKGEKVSISLKDLTVEFLAKSPNFQKAIEQDPGLKKLYNQAMVSLMAESTLHEFYGLDSKDQLDSAKNQLQGIKDNTPEGKSVDMAVMQFVQGGNTQAYGSNSLLRKHEDGQKLLQALHVAVALQLDQGVEPSESEALANVLKLANRLEDMTNGLTNIGLKGFYSDNTSRSSENWDFRIRDDYTPDQLSPDQLQALKEAQSVLREMHAEAKKNEANLDKSSTSLASGIAVTDGIGRVLKEVEVLLGERPLSDNK